MRWMVLEERAVLVVRREEDEDEVGEGWTAAFGRVRRRGGGGLAMMLPALWSGTHDMSSNKQKACLPILTNNRVGGGKVCWCGVAEGEGAEFWSLVAEGERQLNLISSRLVCLGCLVLLENGRLSSAAASGATSEGALMPARSTGFLYPEVLDAQRRRTRRRSCVDAPEAGWKGRARARGLVRMNNVPTRKGRSKSRVHVAARRTTTSRQSRGGNSEW